MIRNYFKIAWRNLLRQRSFSAINIVGLAIGLASCMLMGLYVFDELSFDRFNDHADRIVRVVFKGHMAGGKFNESHVMPPVAAALKADYPEVQASTRLRQSGFPLVIVDNQPFTGDKLAHVDPNFFEMFTLPFIKGDPSTALADPNAIVLSEQAAAKYFGTQDPIGKLIGFKGSTLKLKVAGVFKDMPRNSHFHYDLLASLNGMEEAKSTTWMQSEFFTYLLLPENYDYKKLEAKLPATMKKYAGPQIQQAFGASYEEFERRGNKIGLFLQPLTDIHLHSDFQYDLGNNGDIKYVYIFTAVAIFMLVIACINFMNLSTAGSSKRAMEIGVRKVMGSRKKELIFQFLTESMVVTFIAMALAIGIALLALPYFNRLSGKELAFSPGMVPMLLLCFVLFGLFVGFAAGSYPALFLSSFKPLVVLKGGSATGSGRSLGLRSGLVVVQFSISIILIIGTTVVYRQLKFIQDKKLGYDKSQVLVIPDTWALGSNQEAFREALQADSRIVSISSSGFLPAGPSSNNNFMISSDKSPEKTVKTLRYEVDEQYVPTLGMNIAAGRNFSKAFATDSTAIILNQTAAKLLGLTKDPLNAQVTRQENDGTKYTLHVIGVVEDFHFKSMHEAITPLVMVLSRGAGTMIAKIKTDDVPGLISKVQQSWNTFKPDLPFTYSFLDERFNETYKAEQKTAEILGIFAGLTVFVACLGLFGLATFTAEQRTKEIGVRKVLGASVAGIVALLSKDFLKLVGIAIVLAVPVAWWLMDYWLRDFAYRTEIAWWMFAVAGILAVVVALLTISFQSVKAALMNPVRSLRAE
ncbi:ABC transporter permease [Dyadobacter sandarakinus]|uniref:ABC transporter permease n=1 Tax=Dyadobacter sandarakinus TaxID=2747268 RepID=A0ABX7I3L0_9BACT|nr:ABC transporter permease [Dyadobacter sandarakinus]QRR00385.1 ABC transporter permease [Dyadobacter sandarakinus]